MLYVFVQILWLVLCCDSSLFARELSFPSPLQSLETSWENIDGINLMTPNTLLLLPHHQKFLIKTSFDPSKGTRDEVFGNFIKSKKVPISVVMSFHGSWHQDNLTYLWDGVTMEFTLLDESMNLVRRQSIVLDKIRPPRDMIGELTDKKILAARQRFMKAYRASKPPFFPGIAPLPSGWVSPKKIQFVLPTRIAGYPIVTLECEDHDPISCHLARACKVQGPPPTPDHISGIAVSSEQKKILIGDSLSRKIRVYKFKSCESIPKAYEILLPKQLKALTNLFVDRDDRLWVTTSHRDDYNNSSAFFWKTPAWSDSP